MKIKRLFLLGLIAVFAASCVKEQAETQTVPSDGDVIEAGIGAPATKTYVEKLEVKWAAGDRITAFLGTESKSLYQLSEGAGTTYGYFTKVNGSLVGSPINGNYAIYSYNDEAILEDGKILVDLPVVQTFAPNSFGPGANTMVAFSETKTFYFQNVGGYFVVPMTGNVAVKSITIQGGDSEHLAGRAVVSLDKEGPVIEGIRRFVPTIKLVCEEPVQLDPKEPVEFWFVVPPTRFSMGLSVEIEYNDGEVYQASPGAKSFNIERNEIYRMDPLDLTKKELTIKRLWGKYPDTCWPAFSQNLDRCATMDEDYIYVAQQGGGKKGVWAIPLDGDLDKAVEVCMDGVESEGTHYTSCVRTIWDPATEKHILLLCNLALEGGTHLYLYAYENGINAAPTKLLKDYTLPTWAERRFGDFFTVVGDWSNGYVWFRTNTSGASTTARWNIVNGALKSQTPDGFNYGYGASQGKGQFYQYDMSAKSGLLVTDKIGLFYDLNSAEGQAWNGIDQDSMRRMFGITPFEYDGKKYIAFTKMKNDNAARSWLTIIEDKGTAADFKASLEENKIVYQAAVQIEEEGASTNVVPGATFSDQTSANCAVVVKEDGAYIMAHHHNVGVSLFKMAME